MAFTSLEPIGFRGELYGHALTSSVVVNSSPRKRGAKVVTPDDFMPSEREEAPSKDFVGSFKDYIKRASSNGKKK